jgi:hypothetical protein
LGFVVFEQKIAKGRKAWARCVFTGGQGEGEVCSGQWAVGRKTEKVVCCPP